MNKRQLRKLGVPEFCLREAIVAVQRIVAVEAVRGKDIQLKIKRVLESPDDLVADATVGPFAQALVEHRDFVPSKPVSYQTWGNEGIESGTHVQMQQACSVPIATSAALMPDAHIGYGLPIGGVLACDNAVIPYAVGVDIACRMKLSILDLKPELLDQQAERFKDSLQRGTCFGVGAEHQCTPKHDVLDRDWNITEVTRRVKNKAWKQLGTSGSGNHFVEFGRLTVDQEDERWDVPAGQYVALLSHSGSRGAGAAVCTAYSQIARQRIPPKYADLQRLAWLDLDSEAGQEYWAAMNLMGEYAAANHEVIHQMVTKLVGAEILSGVENHHNFAWKEIHQGKEVIVHRKGATPASKDKFGVIPGTMADPAFVVCGKGNSESLRSASHGAGRRMSRKKARDQYRWKAVKNDLEKRGVHVLSADADEVPNVYKNIHDVMRQQEELVEIVARFDPKIVKMCGASKR